MNYTGDDVEEVFCLNFTIAETYFGEVIHKPLKSEGENTPVTRANREEFVKLYVDYMLNKSCEASFEAFKKGFLRVVNNQVLQLFHAKVRRQWAKTTCYLFFTNFLDPLPHCYLYFHNKLIWKIIILKDVI